MAHNTLTRRTRNLLPALAAAAAAVAIIFGGLQAVGAQSAGAYACQTYGAGDYNDGDCNQTASQQAGGSSSTASSTSSKSTTTSSGSSASVAASSADPVSGPMLNDFSDFRAGTGHNLTLKQGDVVYFSLVSQKYALKVHSFDAATLTMGIDPASSLAELPLALNVARKVDADGDGWPDIAVTYATLATDKLSVGVTFAALSARAATPVINGSAQGESAGGSTAAVAGFDPHDIWWVWVSPIFIGFALLGTAGLMHRRRRKMIASGSIFNQA